MELNGYGASMVFGTGMGPWVAGIVAKIRGFDTRHRTLPDAHGGSVHRTVAIRTCEMNHLRNVSMEPCADLVRGY